MCAGIATAVNTPGTQIQQVFSRVSHTAGAYLLASDLLNESTFMLGKRLKMSCMSEQHDSCHPTAPVPQPPPAHLDIWHKEMAPTPTPPASYLQQLCDVMVDWQPAVQHCSQVVPDLMEAR
jgi:hypothetical protein